LSPIFARYRNLAAVGFAPGADFATFAQTLTARPPTFLQRTNNSGH
jgi:hypothetical protein